MKWLTVPVESGAGGRNIDEVKIGRSRKPWIEGHRGLIRNALKNAPYFDDVLRLWSDGVAKDCDHLSELNERMLRLVCEYLGISTRIIRARPYMPVGDGTARLLDLLRKLEAGAYLSGPSAEDYLDKEAFRRSGIRLEYKSYDYLPYPQLWGPFDGAVSILDLIANCGPQAARLIQSLTPDRTIVDLQDDVS